MKWKGKEIRTVGDMMNFGIDACATKEEAQEFMRLYVAEFPGSARQNIGYLASYYDRENRHRIFDWFDVVHPFFGREDPSAEEAFAAGKRWAESGATMMPAAKPTPPTCPKCKRADPPSVKVRRRDFQDMWACQACGEFFRAALTARG